MGSVFEHVHFSEFPKCGESKNKMWTKCGTWSNMFTKCWQSVEIHGTYPGNIYGIYTECIRNFHRYLWYKIIRNTDPMGRPPKAAAPLGCRRRRRLCFWLFCIINIYGYSLDVPYMFHTYFLSMFHIFSLVCFLIYSVSSNSGHDQITLNLLI